VSPDVDINPHGLRRMQCKCKSSRRRVDLQRNGANYIKQVTTATRQLPYESGR